MRLAAIGFSTSFLFGYHWITTAAGVVDAAFVAAFSPSLRSTRKVSGSFLSVTLVGDDSSTTTIEPQEGIEEIDTSTSKLASKDDSKSLIDLIGLTAYGSSMIYTVAELRKVVRKHGQSVREELYQGKPEPKKLFGIIPFGNERMIKFSGPEDIITQIRSPQEEARSDYTTKGFLQSPITADDVASFIKENKDLIQINNDGEIRLKNEDQPDNTSDPMIYQTLRRLSRTDIRIVAFDDQFQDSELLYAIAINDTFKRISLVFRGSVTGNRDWPTNLKFRLVSIRDLMAKARSSFISEKDASRVADAKLHNGFSNYLFGPLPKVDNQKRRYKSKFDKIVSTLKAIYEERDEETGRLKHADYQLCISGHSLGGALSQLMAFAFCSSGACLDILPSQQSVVAITYASPSVGNEAYSKAMENLEATNVLRHLRITNQGDVVPVGFVWGYTQTGLNLHAREKQIMEVAGFGNTKSFLSQVNFGAGKCHSMNSYQARLFYKEDGENVNGKIWRHSVEDVYDIVRKGGDVLSLPVTYDVMTVKELKNELVLRGLKVSGNKADLIARLQKNDLLGEGNAQSG